MKATVCLDAIGGTMTGRMLNCMPKHSIVYVYGALDGPKVNTLDVKDFIYNDATVTGFFLPNWL
jgi:NADPH2:quinone reductase